MQRQLTTMLNSIVQFNTEQIVTTAVRKNERTMMEDTRHKLAHVLSVAWSNLSIAASRCAVASYNRIQDSCRRELALDLAPPSMNKEAVATTENDQGNDAEKHDLHPIDISEVERGFRVDGGRARRIDGIGAVTHPAHDTLEK